MWQGHVGLSDYKSKYTLPLYEGSILFKIPSDSGSYFSCATSSLSSVNCLAGLNTNWPFVCNQRWTGVEDCRWWKQLNLQPNPASDSYLSQNVHLTRAFGWFPGFIQELSNQRSLQNSGWRFIMQLKTNVGSVDHDLNIQPLCVIHHFSRR